MQKTYDVDTPNRLTVIPEPGILLTRDNAAWAYHALKAVREAGTSIPEQDSLCDELAALLFPARQEQAVLASEDRPFEPGELIEYVSNLSELALGKPRQWAPGIFARYPDNLPPGAMLIRALRKANGILVRRPGEVQHVSPELISAARSWIADCDWADLHSDEDIADLTDVQVVAGVQRFYAGGWVQFARDGGEDDPLPG